MLIFSEKPIIRRGAFIRSLNIKIRRVSKNLEDKVKVLDGLFLWHI